MPCNSDYMEASGQEMESQRVCRLLVYLHGRIIYSTPKWILAGARDYYGCVSRLSEVTAKLCEACRSLTPEEVEEYIYDAHDETARELASWWERHKAWDVRRVREEQEEREWKALRASAIAKLTQDEVDALRIMEIDDAANET